jgi:hypothetical protein
VQVVEPAELWHERVEDVLTVELGLLARRGISPRTQGVLGPSPEAPPTGLGAIEALAGIGLLDAPAAAYWRGRFADADREFPPIEPGPELRERLHRYLADLLRHANADRNEHLDSSMRLRSVLGDLRRFGLLDDDEAGWWIGLLDARMGPEPDEQHPEPRFERLLRSVPGSPFRRRGLRVLSADLFEDGVVVRMHLARNGRAEDGGVTPLPDEVEPSGRFVSRQYGLLMRDDVGTRYRPAGVGGGGGTLAGSGYGDGPLSFHLERGFAPAVPEAARLLLVYADDIQCAVRL